MKIEIERLAAPDLESLDDIGDRYGLTLHVTEGSKAYAIGGWNERSRWCASFRDLEIMERSMLVSASGNGPTPKAAIDDYAEKLRGQRVVVHAMSADKRVELWIPENLMGRRATP